MLNAEIPSPCSPKSAGEVVAYASVHLEQARWTRRGSARFASTAVREFALDASLGKRLTEGNLRNSAKSLGLRKLSAMMTPDQVVARTFRSEAAGAFRV